MAIAGQWNCDNQKLGCLMSGFCVASAEFHNFLCTTPIVVNKSSFCRLWLAECPGSSSITLASPPIPKGVNIIFLRKQESKERLVLESTRLGDPK
jgi:hypothetical protein